MGDPLSENEDSNVEEKQHTTGPRLYDLEIMGSTPR